MGRAQKRGPQVSGLGLGLWELEVPKQRDTLREGSVPIRGRH